MRYNNLKVWLWNKYLNTENDVMELERYVAFAEPNFKTYSSKLGEICLDLGTEFECVNKYYIKYLKVENLLEKYPKIKDEIVYMPRHKLKLTPFKNLNNSNIPEWLSEYYLGRDIMCKNVFKNISSKHIWKHFNLGNVLNALAANFLIIQYFYLDIVKSEDFIGCELKGSQLFTRGENEDA